MKTTKRVIAMLLTIAMVLTMFSMVTISASAAEYADTMGHWAESIISEWSDYGVIQGDNGYFRPDDAITRAEVAQVTQNIISYTGTMSNVFTDVASGAWYEDAILKLAAAGTLTGNGDGTMSPENYMTREEAMTMLARAFGLKVENTNAAITQYADYESVSDYATGYVGTMTAAGYVSGYEDGTIRPQANVSRAEFVKIIDNMIKLYITTSGTYGPSYYGGIVMVKSAGVVLSGVVADGVVISPQVSGSIELKDSQFSGEVLNLSATAKVTSNNTSYASTDDVVSTIVSGNSGSNVGGGTGGFTGGGTTSTLTVKFYVGGSAYATKKVAKNSYLTSLPNDPTKSGKVFVGWFETSGEADDAINSTAIDFDSTRIKKSMSVYAGFVDETALPTATVAPDAPTATVAPDAPTATVAPDAPTATVAPEAPTATVAPDAPTATVAPETPTATVAPEAPTATVAPETPTATAVPGGKPGADDPIVAQESAKSWIAKDNYDNLLAKAVDASNPNKFDIDDMNMDNLYLRSSAGSRAINYENMITEQSHPENYTFADGSAFPAQIFNFRGDTEMEFIPSATKSGVLKLYYHGKSLGETLVTVTQGDNTMSGEVTQESEDTDGIVSGIVEVNVAAGANVVIKSVANGWLAAIVYIPSGEGTPTADPSKTAEPTATVAPVVPSATAAPTLEPVKLPTTEAVAIPTAKAENVLTVDASATTDEATKTFKTVTEALNYAKTMNSHQSEDDRIQMNIAPGTYREQIMIDIPYITMQKTPEAEGEVLFTWYYGIGYLYYSIGSDGYYSKDAYETNKANGAVSTAVGVNRWGCATRLSASDFAAKDITFENSFNRYVTDEEIDDGVTPAAQGAPYTDTGNKPVRTKDTNVYGANYTERAAAIAIEDNTDRSMFYNCKFLSSQDTVYSGSGLNRIYFKDCTIQGQTDYIFGGNTLVFDNCNFAWAGYGDSAKGGHVTATRNTSTDKGYLLYGGQVVEGDMENAKYANGDFGRPWGGNDSPTAAIGVKINTKYFSNTGWSDWSSKGKESKYYEYGTASSDGSRADLSKRNCLVPDEWEALAFNPYSYLTKDGVLWDPMGVGAVWQPVVDDMKNFALTESDTLAVTVGQDNSYKASGNFTLPTELAGYDVHYETDSLYLTINDDNTVEVVRPIEGVSEATITAYIRKSDSKMVGASKDIKIIIIADSTIDPEPFKASMTSAKAAIDAALGTPDETTGEYTLNRTVPVPTIEDKDGVVTTVKYTVEGSINSDGTIDRNPYASGKSTGKINYVIECIKGNSLYRQTYTYNVVIPPMGGDLLYADFEDGATAVGGKLTAKEGGNNSGYGVVGAISATPKTASKEDVTYAFDVKGNQTTTFKVNNTSGTYLTLTLDSSVLTQDWNTVEMTVSTEAVICSVNDVQIADGIEINGSISSTSELGAISLSNGTYDNIKVIDGEFNDGSKVYSSFWKASAADKGVTQGTMLMRGMTIMADANSCNNTSVTMDGETFSYYVSNSSASGGWSNGAAKDGGIGFKFVAPADGQWTVYVTNLGSNKTFCIGSPDEEKKVSGAEGGNQFLTINVKAGQTYYATVAGSKGRFVGAKYVPTVEGGEAIDPDASRMYKTTWAFGSKIWGAKNINGAENIETYTSADTDNLRTAETTLTVDPTTGGFNNATRTDEWCGWGNGAKITVPVVNGSMVSVKVYYTSDTFTINGAAFGPFSGTDNTVTYTYIGKAGNIDIVSTQGGFISYVKVESPVKPQEFKEVENDITYLSDPADTVDFADSNAAKSKAGESVTFAATAKAGHAISSVQVLDAADDTNISAAGLANNGDGTWTFTMPQKAVKIKVATVESAVVSGTVSGIETADVGMAKLYLLEGTNMTQVNVAADGAYSVELIGGKTYSIFGLIGGTNAYTLSESTMTTASAPTLDITATKVIPQPTEGTKSYSFEAANTVIPGSDSNRIPFANFVTADGIVSFNTPDGSLKYWNSHGLNMGNTTIKVAVAAGDSKISFAACQYAGADTTMTALSTGITPSEATSMKASSCGSNVIFTYSGEATVLEFAYTGSYLHGVSVKTTAAADPSQPTATPKPALTSVDYSVDFTKQNDTHSILTAEETAKLSDESYPKVSFGLKADGTRVDVDSSDAVWTFENFKYHSEEHGLNPGTLKVEVPGPVKITYGSCGWGGDVTVKNSDGVIVASMNTNNGVCYDGTNVEGYVETYYKGGATLLTLTGGSYVPYIAVKTVDVSEIPNDATVTFAAGDDTFEGSLPEAITADIDTEVTIPENRTMYIEGKTLVQWTDGVNNYKTGETLTLTEDVTLTPVFADNIHQTLSGTVVFDFQRQNGAPTVAWQGSTNFLVSQLTDEDGVKTDVKMDVDTTNGKLANANWTDWAQVNTGTKFTVPVNANSTVTVGTIFGSDGTYTIGGVSKTGSNQSETIAAAGTCEIVAGNPSGSYWRTITVIY